MVETRSITSQHKSRTDEISPQLAAKVVKDYILPMFESKGKS